MSMFKKVLMTIGLLLAVNGVLLAQGTLKGKVVDKKTGEEMPLVNVIAKQNGQQVGGAQTDFEGVYTLKGLAVGKYDIEVSFVGYQKYVRAGVDVKSSGFTVVNVDLNPSATVLDEVVIEVEKVPVIEIGTPESGQRISSDDIARMPGTSVESIVAAVGGVGFSDGGTGTARGEGGMVNIQGGVVKRSGVTPPKEAIAEIQVILGGTPASIGEAIGGTQIVTLKPPTNQFKGVVKWDSYLDYRLANTLMVYLTGPVAKKKTKLEGGGISERAFIGFRFTGQGQYVKDGYYRPRSKRYKTVNPDKVAEIERNPIVYNPLTGSVNYAAESLRASDFQEITVKPNLSSVAISTEGALDFSFSEYSRLQLTGEFAYSKGASSSTAYFPLNMNQAGSGVSESMTYGITADYTQRIPDQQQSADATTPDAKSAAAISNVLFNVTFMYNRSTARSYNEQFGKNLNDVFKYGYIGKFQLDKVPFYEPQSNYDYNGITRAAYVQSNWYDSVTIDWNTFGQDGYNPLKANYLISLHNNQQVDNILSSMNYNYDMIRQYYGLINGDGPSSIYSLISNVGLVNTSFAMSNSEYIYLQAKASALIKGHDLEVGVQYDHQSNSYYGLGASSLWTIMRQDANAHILQMDVNNPIYSWQGSDLYVSFDRILEEDQQKQFDKEFRDYLASTGRGIGAKDWLDIDRYTPEDYAACGLKMFSADEFLNSGNAIASYYGYTHTGERYNGKGWSLDKFFNSEDRLLPAFAPTYLAGYIQDKFFFQDLIFNVGVRVDYFDGNQWVLKDPYLLYESWTVGELQNAIRNNAQNSDGTPVAINGQFANNAQDNWVVYVDDANATKPTILGYRDNETHVWYDAKGTEVSSPSQIAGTSGKPTPFRTESGRLAKEKNTADVNAFKDYYCAPVVMPRIAFSFPVSDQSQFKASYDIITRRPSSGWQADYVSYMFMTQASSTSNPNLKPERITNYELGFQQALNQSSAVGISAYYKETRDLIQIVQYAGADPNPNYYSYDNLDFRTIKGFTFSYDLRQTKNIRINANYTLQYAEGTGLTTTTMTELIKEGYTTLKMLNPIADDRRHEIKANVDFRYFSGTRYNGPVIKRTVKDENGELVSKDIKLLENFGINFMAVAQSGRPYTKQFSNTQATIVGSYRGARLPWGFYFNAVADKTWPIQVGHRQTALTAAITVNNVFNIRNVVGVFAVTGNPEDNGYLTDPETQSLINSCLDPTSYRDLYNLYMNNNVWNYSSPRTIRLSLSYNF